MQHKELYEEFEGGIFICRREKNYVEKRRKIDRSNGPWASQLGTPKSYQMSPYKLHITLDLASYLKHKEPLIAVLTGFLSSKPGWLKDFKFVNHELIETDTNFNKQMIQLLQAYKEFLLHATPFNMEELQKQWEIYEGEKKPLPQIDEIDEEIQSLNKQINTRDRFLTADQFTLYIPENYNKKVFFQLCQAVNSFLSANNAVAGDFSDVASPIGPYMSLRQEYLLNDFDEINTNGRVNTRLRIDSLALDTNETIRSKRQQVVKEQEKSRLYQYLNQQPAHSSIFDEKKPSTEKEDSSDKKKYIP